MAADKKFQDLNNTPDVTGECSAEDIQNGKVMGVLAYIGILVLIPILAAKNNRFARFHANQGAVLFIINVVYNIAVRIVVTILGLISLKLAALISTLLGLVSWVFVILAILGIVNVVQGKAKELPVIGGIKIIK